MNSTHPCFNHGAHGKHGRLHLPVAERCNIVCGFCDRQYSCVNESRPGVTARLLTPEAAFQAAQKAVFRMPSLSVIGIAGPGDPLANPTETLETFTKIHMCFPQMLLCLSTNGLALPRYAEDLIRLGVHHVTVTVNAVNPVLGAQIYLAVQDQGATWRGVEGAALLCDRQEAGIRKLKSAGVTIKVNTVVVPGVNDQHIGVVAETVKRWGADVMNCIPLIPVAGTPLGNCSEPSSGTMCQIRKVAEQSLPQMRHCARCRADACGLLGESGVLSDLVRHRSSQNGQNMRC